MNKSNNKFAMSGQFYQKVALFLGSIVISLLIFELMLRYTSIIPLMQGDAPQEQGKWLEESVVYNSQGFRDEEFLQKKDNDFRIAMLGDSIGFGWHVEKDKTLADRLEKAFEIEVVNLSKFGIHLEQEVNYLEKYNQLLEPDLILEIINPNDIEIPPIPSRGLVARAPFEKLEYHLNKYTYTYPFIRVRLNLLFERLGLRETYFSWNEKLFDNESEQWKKFTRSLDELKSLADGKPVVVVMFTGIIDFSAYDWQLAREKIKEASKARGFYYLDLVPRFSEYDPAELVASSSDGHPNAKANEMAAEWLTVFIKENNLVSTHSSEEEI